jgi:hypothetical protein
VLRLAGVVISPEYWVVVRDFWLHGLFEDGNFLKSFCFASASAMLWMLVGTRQPKQVVIC